MALVRRLIIPSPVIYRTATCETRKFLSPPLPLSRFLKFFAPQHKSLVKIIDSHSQRRNFIAPESRLDHHVFNPNFRAFQILTNFYFNNFRSAIVFIFFLNCSIFFRFFRSKFFPTIPQSKGCDSSYFIFIQELCEDVRM